MSDIPETVMIECCEGCAARPGTEAHRSQFTQRLFHLCIFAGVPFECHGIGNGHLCHAFVDAYQKKMNRGDYDALPEWKRKLLLNLIDAMHEYRTLVEAGKTPDVDALIRQACIT